MRRQRNGLICVVASVCSLRGFAGASIYCGSKWALLGIVESLQEELRADHIRVTAVLPGWVNTVLGVQDSALPDARYIPMILQPDDVADVVSYVASVPDNVVLERVTVRAGCRAPILWPARTRVDRSGLTRTRRPPSPDSATLWAPVLRPWPTLVANWMQGRETGLNGGPKMALLAGQLSRREIEARYADVAAVAGARPAVLQDGLSDGLRVVEVWTGSGLAFDVLTGRGMDVGAARYRGTPISWRSATGDVSPAPLRARWPWLVAYVSWRPAGRLRPPERGRPIKPMAGKPGSSWPTVETLRRRRFRPIAGGMAIDIRFRVRGSVREARPLGEYLYLTRTITTWLGADEILVEDTVTNRGIRRHPTCSCTT